MADRVFRDRSDAGRVVAGRLTQLEGQPGLLVLGLPRGGLPVAYEVAAALGAPLDIFVVRKLGVPGHEELAMGAISSGEVVVLNDDVVRGLGIGPEVIQQVAEREGRELLRREQAYREGRPAPDPAGRTVILVDDGLATGASMQAAILALRDRGPDRIVVAVPAAPESTSRELQLEVDEVICATTPSPFFAVGASYWDFTQTRTRRSATCSAPPRASTSGATSGQDRGRRGPRRGAWSGRSASLPAGDRPAEPLLPVPGGRPVRRRHPRRRDPGGRAARADGAPGGG
jgi:predicted phosphoribosyltransferase